MLEVEQLAEGIYVVPHFLSDEECQSWIDYCEAKGFEEATVNAGRGRMVMMKSIRNNERYIHDDPALAEVLWQRAKNLVPSELNISIACGLNERFRFYKYRPGHRFRQHQDGSYIRNINEWSEYTFMVYLNEGMSGGATNFLKLPVFPETGKALIFNHKLLHEGAEVTSGTKYVLRSDVMYRRKGT
ncbi:MAG: 2OG-Fe(II) oxygenase [Bacteroidota bacterium]